MRRLFDPVEKSELGHVAAAPGLDVVAAGEVELPVVDPPGHVEVHASRAVFVVSDHLFELRKVADAIGARGIHEIAADGAARVRQALGESRRAGVQQKARGLAGARGENHHASPNVPVAQVGFVDVGHAAREAVVIRRHFARHGSGQDREPPGGERRGKERGGRREVRAGGASPAALAAVVAGGATVQRLRQDGSACWNAGDAELVAALFHQELPAPGRRRRLEDSVWLVLDALVRPVDPDQPIELVVVRGDIVVGDRPVIAETVMAPRLEIARTEAEGDPPPVVRSSAEHPRAEPVERRARTLCVRLALRETSRRESP